MSHITLKEGDRADQQIKNLDALKRAVARCGGVFLENRMHFCTWADDHNGRLVGDWPLPDGFSLAELQDRCRHAISVSGLPGQYEIGVVASKKFPGTYSLAYDFFGGSLDSAFGAGCQDLMMLYHAEALRSVALAGGDAYSEQVLPDGTILAEMDTTARMGV